MQAPPSIARRRLTQDAAAEKLGIDQPKVSALADYRLGDFSVERLMTFPRSRAAARISAVAA